MSERLKLRDLFCEVGLQLHEAQLVVSFLLQGRVLWSSRNFRLSCTCSWFLKVTSCSFKACGVTLHLGLPDGLFFHGCTEEQVSSWLHRCFFLTFLRVEGCRQRQVLFLRQLFLFISGNTFHSHAKVSIWCWRKLSFRQWTLGFLSCHPCFFHASCAGCGSRQESIVRINTARFRANLSRIRFVNYNHLVVTVCGLWYTFFAHYEWRSDCDVQRQGRDKKYLYNVVEITRDRHCLKNMSVIRKSQPDTVPKVFTPWNLVRASLMMDRCAYRSRSRFRAAKWFGRHMTVRQQRTVNSHCHRQVHREFAVSYESKKCSAMSSVQCFLNKSCQWHPYAFFLVQSVCDTAVRIVVHCFLSNSSFRSRNLPLIFHIVIHELHVRIDVRDVCLRLRYVVMSFLRT